MREGTTLMLGEIISLQDQSRDISSGMEKIAQEIVTINSGAEAVSKLAVDANTTVEKIQKVVDGFTI